MRNFGCNADDGGNKAGSRTPIAAWQPDCGSRGENRAEIKLATFDGRGGARCGAGRKRSPPPPPPPRHQGLRWYCLQVERRGVHRTVERLQELQFLVLRQMMVERLPDRPARVVEAFPGYLFVSFDAGDPRWRAIPSTRGVLRLFSAGPERPLPIPHGVIEALQAKTRQTGLIDEGLPAPSLAAAGDQVTIAAGALAGFHGMCTWSSAQRVAVLVELFGRSISMQLAQRQVRQLEA
jgi:transcription antitermination factor NusG